MPRLLFEKKGNAVWISHLDLMRLFQRAFQRAGLPLRHTQGFNQRPIVSIALPLSVGVSSECELLDFDLDGSEYSNEEICGKLNSALVSGVRVLDVYDDGRKLKELAYLKCMLTLEYDRGVPQDAVSEITKLFASDSLLVEKKGKNGVTIQDIVPMILSLSVKEMDANTLEICAVICCQNPSLNPAQLVAAIKKYQPALSPDFARYSRKEIFDTKKAIFR